MWNPEVECLPREQLEELQLARLRATVARVLRAVPPFAERLRAAGIGSADDITSLADLSRLPFSTKADLRENYPFGLLAVPREEVIRFHASSGTRGKPTVVAYTKNDLAMWAEVMARSFTLAGVRRGMTMHNAYGYGLFTGGLGLQQGADLLGVTVVPISSGLSKLQVTLLRDLGSEVLCCTPSYALNLAQALQEMGIDPASLKMRIGIFGAEPWTEAMRAEIEGLLGIRAIDFYGLSEIIGPGVSTECAEARRGSHVQEDHFLPEVVNPDTGELLPPGVQGELVITTITKEATPMIRFRTGDISSINQEPCVCGRTSFRLSRIRGRYDDMLIIRGANLYPSEVERILLSAGGVAPYYQIIVERPPGELDEIIVICEPNASGARDFSLANRIKKALYDETGINMDVRVAPPGGLPRSEGKAVRVVDKRRKK